MFSEIWITTTALARMKQDASEFFSLETGGVLVGYRSGSSQVVTNIVGSGPRAVRTAMSFEADHEYQCEELDRLFLESKGVAVYLGDWHTHPLSSPELSETDRRTLRRIARHAPANCPSPLMMVGAGGPTSWSWKAHLFDRTRLWRKIYSCPLTTFAPPAERR